MTKIYLKPHETMGDYVKCCNCDETMLISIGSETCPNCNCKGYLAWVDKPQEYNKFDILGGIEHDD